MKREGKRKWLVLMALLVLTQTGCQKTSNEIIPMAGDRENTQSEEAGQEGRQAEQSQQENDRQGEKQEAAETLDEIAEVSGMENEKPVDMATADHSVNGRELPVYCVETQDKKVALTFDAAWGNEDTEKILEILNKHKLHVTFFMTGGWVESYPEDVKAILAAGHDLGNHSENHKNMSQLSDDEKKEEIMKVHERVKELTGYEMFLFRPPYGDYDNAVIDVLKNCRYYGIQWDVDSLDWQNKGVDAIIKTVTEHKNLGDGSIILCHNGAEYTAEALDTLICALEEQGYEIVPLSELIYRDNYHLNYEGRQIKNSDLEE